MIAVPRGARTWLAGGLCALAVCASLLTLTGPIAPGRWLPIAVAAVLGLAAVLAVARALTSAWWAPTLIGTCATGLGVLAAYASPPGRFQALPSTDSIARLGDSIRAALEYTEVSRPPVDATRPLELLIVGGALLVLLVTDLIALGLAAPAWSALALLALWLPGIALGRGATGWAFVGTSAAYLLLLALTAAPPPGARGARVRADTTRRAGLAVAGAATVMVAAIVLGPVAGSTPGWSTVRLPDLGSAGPGSLRLAQDLDLRESLGARSSEVVLTYRADPVTVGPLRVFTLRDFDGENWSRDDRSLGLAPDDVLLWPARDLVNRPADEAAPTRSNVTVRVVGLREERLPVPVMPRTVDVDGRWSYDAERDEVVRVGVTRPGTIYSMRVELLDITAASLRGAETDYPADMEQYLSVPRTARTGDVAAAAVEVTSAASGRYEQALALQSYFRSAQNFTYDTEVPPARSNDAVWDFLGSRTGYCVQFATAMTVMARTLGIPARLAVGFLPGSINEAGENVVTGRDSHAWPELYFSGAGWVRFEPTPAVQTGAPPRWADPFAGSGGAPIPEENPDRVGAVPTALPTQSVPTGPAAPDAGADNRLLYGAGGAVAVLLLVVAWWIVRQRRAAREGSLSPEVAWARLRARLGSVGITFSDARTPQQVAALVAAELARRGGAPMRAQAQDALNELALAVQDHRYAPNPRVWETGELERWVDAVQREITSPAPVTVLSG